MFLSAAWAGTLVSTVVFAVSCGSPTFTGQNKSKKPSAVPEPTTQSADQETRETVPSTPDASVDSSRASKDTGAEDPAGKTYGFSDARSDEAEALTSCLRTFKDHPFGDKDIKFKRIDATISIFGDNTPIDDREKTDSPSLILINTSINVGGSPTFNMLNPNGYYCMKNSVNVVTDLTINVSCSARLADSSFKLDVFSDVKGNGDVAKNGVFIGSDIVVNDLKDDAETYKCIR